MAIVKLEYPITALRGVLNKKSGFYARMVHGKCEVRRRPQMQSEKRIAACQRFGAIYGTARKKKETGNSATEVHQGRTMSARAPLKDR